MFSSPPERAAADARAPPRDLVRRDLRRQLARAHRAHLPAALDVAAAVRPGDHRIDAGALRDRLPRGRRGRPGRGDPAGPDRRRLRAAVRARGRPVPGRVYLSPQTEWRRFDLSQLDDAGAAASRRWAMLGGSGRGRAARSRVGAAPRRHAVPGRQEHGAARARCSDASGSSCSSTSRRWSRIGLAGGAAFTASALRPLTNLNATVREILRTGQGAVARAGARNTGDALDELGHAGQRDARSHRVAHRRHARRARQRRARSAHADDAPAQHRRNRAAVGRRRRRRSARRSPTASRSPTAWWRC